jgi:predicted RNA-binding Zn-ribbon protein involved in translation (DUF1610 family)
MPRTPTIDPNLSLEDLVRRLSAAVRADQVRLFDSLIARTRSGTDSLKAFKLLAAVKPNGSRLALEYAARMPEPIPPAIVLFAAQALQDRSNPIPIRLVVAGKLLATLPDTPQAVGPVVRSVTAGLSRSKTLQRMIDLQSRVDKCNTLDRMVEANEKVVKLRCPKCPAKLTRTAFIRHLWHKHRLKFDRGLAVDPRAEVEQSVSTAATSDDPNAIDRAFELSPHYYPQSTLVQVLQAIASRQMMAGFPVPNTLTRSAADQSAGLCPTCLNPVPDPILPVPPSLAVGGGRLSGDGYAVEVTDTPTGRAITVITPKEERAETPAGSSRFDPRRFGVLMAVPVLTLGIIFVTLMPSRWVHPFIVALGVTILGWLLYLAGRFTRKELPTPDDVAVDIAWQSIVPELGKSKASARWLTRLCRASVDRGSALDRVKEMYDLTENAAVWADKGGVYLPLFAAVRVLDVCDGAAMGKDKANKLLSVFEPFFLGELPAGYAEAAAEIICTDRVLSDGDAKRFAVLLTAAAFEATYTPLDLLRVLRFLPHLRILFGTPTADLLKMQYAVWRGRHSEPWAEVGRATTVFELAKSSPGVCRKMLAAHPDLLLRIDLPDSAARELGEVVLTARGLVVAGKLLTDPDGETELTRSPRGSGWMLALGAQKINLDRKLDWNSVERIVNWLRYRLDKLVPLAEGADRINLDRIRRVLTPLVQDCPLCGRACVCRTGRVGEPWPMNGG